MVKMMLPKMMVAWVMRTKQVLWAQLQCKTEEAWKPEEAAGKGFKAKTFKTSSGPSDHNCKGCARCAEATEASDRTISGSWHSLKPRPRCHGTICVTKQKKIQIPKIILLLLGVWSSWGWSSTAGKGRRPCDQPEGRSRDQVGDRRHRPSSS